MSTLLAVERVLAFFGVAVFMATYAVMAPWRRSETGRNIMTWSGGALILVGLGILRQLFAGADVYRQAYPGEALLLALGWLVFNTAVWWRWVMLLRAQAGNLDSDGPS